MSDDDETRTRTRRRGVEFGPLGDELDDATYPLTASELVDAYGAYTLDVHGTERTLREVLGPVDATYESAAAVRRGVLTMVGAEAVGREGYSDRGGLDASERTEESA
jgi:hypothetical protein